MVKYYLDTSIWLDHYEKRGRNGEIALALISKILNENEIIIYSDFHINELKSLSYKLNEIRGIVRVAKPNNIEFAHTNREQLEEAKRIKKYIKIPIKDIIHSIIARDNEAILVYTDKHFEKLKYLIDIKKPIELI